MTHQSKYLIAVAASWLPLWPCMRMLIVACVARVFLEDLQLVQHLQALRRYLFQAAGDAASGLAEGLCHELQARGGLTSSSVRRVFEDSLKVRINLSDPMMATEENHQC